MITVVAKGILNTDNKNTHFVLPGCHIGNIHCNNWNIHCDNWGAQK